MANPSGKGGFDTAVAGAVSAFGAEVKDKLKGQGAPEDQLRGPVDDLVCAVARALGLRAVLYGEVRLVDLKAQPDFGVEVAGAMVGYLEIKRPRKGADTEAFTGHDARQWHKLRLLPNVLYTDGNQWALYRNGRRIGEIAQLSGPIKTAGSKLIPADGEFVRVLKDFLYWEPQPPRTIDQLVHAIAGLCRLLRTEVTTALHLETSGERTPLFIILAEDWRKLLFPDADDEDFADQYAQTVTFALLLARVEGISFTGQDVGAIAKKLGKSHSLMGKALAVLTDDPDGRLGVTLDTLVHVIGAVDWDQLDDGSGDAYLHLYEEFLAVYDPQLRQETGSYYTPNEVVRFMVGFTEQLLRNRLELPQGFAAPEVVVVDPAMGTGTFLLNIIEQVAQTVAEDEGDGAVGPRLRDLVSSRLIGFEKQTGPYAVAELRLYEILRRHRSDTSEDGLRLYVTDTLDNPYAGVTQFGSTYAPIAHSRNAANQVKRDEPVMVVLGNPPYDTATKGSGKWIETGDPGSGHPPPINAFRAPGMGRYESVLTNLHAFFWRWATWKVFDQHPGTPTGAGVVAFITTSAYLKSTGFSGMRAYLRQTADEGWIVNVSPEGHRPEVPTRVFPGVQQPLCIGIFTRYGPPRPETAATIHYLAVTGHRTDKFRRLDSLALNDPAWLTCASGWQEPFLPEGDLTWAAAPLLSDMFPWSSRGVTPGRTWVYAPDKGTLTRRWERFLKADPAERRELFGEARDRKLDSRVDPLSGVAAHDGTLAETAGPHPEPERVGYRSFDRQWIIPDHRLMVVARPDLWRVRGPQQLYATEQNAHPITSGPALTFSAYIPDMDHYNGRSGRAIPLYRDATALAPNIAPKLLAHLTQRLGVQVTAEDLLAYAAGVVAHPAYTQRFREDLELPGVRVPLTADPDLWQEAAQLGGEVLWLHTYGQRYADPTAGRPKAPPRLPDDRRPKVAELIPNTTAAMPETISYDPDTLTLHVGSGRIAPVPPQVWGYEVSGMKVVKKWFGYRKKHPDAKRSSPLNDINQTRWTPEYTTELLQLLNVLGRLVDLESAQAYLLDRVCAGPQITTADLRQTGILPVPSSARKPLKDDGATLFHGPAINPPNCEPTGQQLPPNSITYR